MNTEVFENYESSVRSYCRRFPTVFKKSKGAFMYDENGEKYIDFFCGAGAVNYGHNNDYIKPKLIEYIENDGIMHALDMYTTPKRELIEYLEKNILEPRGLNFKVMFPGPTGTNAIEAALKLARKAKGRSNVFSLMGCFHGMTLGALALTTDSAARKGAGVKLNDVTHIPAPYMYPGFDTIKYMQDLLDDDHSGIEKPAALVIETVQAEGGILQGIGMALFEDVQYTDKGKIRNNSFMQYKIPSRMDIGKIRVDFESSYEESGPFGAKSIGELVIDTPCPALAEAIYNATGVRVRELPITPEKIAMGILEKEMEK